MSECPGCGRITVGPEGPPEATILLLGDSPSSYDVKDDTLWTGDFGDLLRAELRRAGINYRGCRVTNLWLHPKNTDCDFQKYHADAALREMRDREVVLLLGAEPVKYISGYGVSEVSGLRVDVLPHREGRLIPNSTGAVYALFNPAVALHNKLGEVRWGIENIAGQLNGE